jgi:hypothetical protein
MGRQQPQAEAEDAQSQDDGDRKKRKGKFLLDGMGCAGMGSDSTANLP